MRTTDFSRVNTVALCGSLGQNSSTHKALTVALEGARELGANVQLLDLREYNLPFAGLTHEPELFPDVARLSSQVRAAQGVLWGAPEYHGSYSGVLKNALDLMGFEEFEGKMIGLIGVAGGSTGAINALTHLRTVGRQLHAWVLPQQVSIARVYQVFEADGSVKDADIEKRLKEMGRNVARFAYLHSVADDPFVKMWEQAAENPGGDQ